jgi:hypothetical protein
VARGTTQLAASATGLISLNTWYWIELAARTDDSTGSYEAKLYDDSGTLLATLSASNVDTRETPGAMLDLIVMGNGTVVTYADSTGVEAGLTARGRGRVETLMPNAAGGLGRVDEGRHGHGSELHAGRREPRQLVFIRPLDGREPGRPLSLRRQVGDGYAAGGAAQCLRLLALVGHASV